MAQTFKNNSAVIFDVFNEPYPDNNQDTDAGWECWRDGGVCGNGISYAAAGSTCFFFFVFQHFL